MHIAHVRYSTAWSPKMLSIVICRPKMIFATHGVRLWLFKCPNNKSIFGTHENKQNICESGRRDTWSDRKQVNLKLEMGTLERPHFDKNSVPPIRLNSAFRK